MAQDVSSVAGFVSMVEMGIFELPGADILMEECVVKAVRLAEHFEVQNVSYLFQFALLNQNKVDANTSGTP